MTARIDDRLKESDRVLLWVHGKLDGLRLPALPDDKRVQLASACWHIAVEHSQAVVVLVHQGLYGSTLALIRPLFEAYVRGLWLLHGATDVEVDDAGNDKFPNNFGRILDDLERSENFGAGHLSRIKGEWWKRLCSFTHTGFQQIGARLTPGGLGYGYADDEIIQALEWADGITLMSVIGFANLVGNQALAVEVFSYLRARSGATEQNEAV